VVQVTTPNNGEINIRVLLIQISNRMLCYVPQEFAPFSFFFFYAAKRTCLARPMDPNGSTAQMHQRQRGRVQNPGPSNAPRFAPAVTGPRLLRDLRRPALIFFYPRSGNYGLALESHPQTRQRPLTWRDFVLAGEAASHVGRKGLWPRLIHATRRVTEAGAHRQMSASTWRSVTVSWPIGPRARGLCVRWTRSRFA
jgi:hypothetical protein